MIYIIISIIIIIIIVSIILISLKKIDELNENIKICTNDIEKTLIEKQEIIEDCIKVLNNKKIKNNYNPNYENIIEQEKTLYKTKEEINTYLNNKKNKEIKNTIKSNIKKLDLIDEDLEGLKNYYNTNVSKFNIIYNKKFFRIIYKLLKIQEKQFFESRKLEDYKI